MLYTMTNRAGDPVRYLEPVDDCVDWEDVRFESGTGLLARVSSERLPQFRGEVFHDSAWRKGVFLRRDLKIITVDYDEVPSLVLGSEVFTTSPHAHSIIVQERSRVKS